MRTFLLTTEDRVIFFCSLSLLTDYTFSPRSYVTHGDSLIVSILGLNLALILILIMKTLFLIVDRFCLNYY